LENGYATIERARERGEDVENWEAFWIDLLGQYEKAARLMGLPPHYDRDSERQG
jgi:hypothetical protein